MQNLNYKSPCNLSQAKISYIGHIQYHPNKENLINRILSKLKTSLWTDPQTPRKHLQIMYLMQDLYPECRKSSQNAAARKQGKAGGKSERSASLKEMPNQQGKRSHHHSSLGKYKFRPPRAATTHLWERTPEVKKVARAQRGGGCERTPSAGTEGCAVIPSASFKLNTQLQVTQPFPSPLFTQEK